MLTSLNFLKKNTARFACVAMVCGSALLTGCAGGSINNASVASAPLQVRPDNIYVYTFDAHPDQVKLDGGMHAVSETKKAGVSADAKRLADAVAKQIAQIGISGGWLSAKQAKG